MNVTQLRNAGFSGSEIQKYVTDQSAKLQRAGFSEQEISEYFGTRPGQKIPTGATRSFAPSIGERAMDVGKQVFEAPKTLGEVGLMLATAGPAWLAGSLGKIGISGYGELTGKDTAEQAKRFQEEVGTGVWQPETKAGKKVGELLGKGFEFITTPVREAAELVGESWDSKTVEAVSQFIGELALFHYGGKGVKEITPKVPEWYYKMSKREQDVVDNMVKEVIAPEEAIESVKPTIKTPEKPPERPVEPVAEKPIPEVKAEEKLYDKYQKLSPDTTTNSFNIGKTKVYKISEAELPQDVKLPEGQKALAFNNGKDIFIIKDLSERKFKEAINHELVHLGLKDNLSFYEEYPDLKPEVKAKPKKKAAPEPTTEEIAAELPDQLELEPERAIKQVEEPKIKAKTKKKAAPKPREEAKKPALGGKEEKPSKVEVSTAESIAKSIQEVRTKTKELSDAITKTKPDTVVLGKDTFKKEIIDGDLLYRRGKERYAPSQIAATILDTDQAKAILIKAKKPKVKRPKVKAAELPEKPVKKIPEKTIAKSKGHVGFTEKYEYFYGDNGLLYRAPKDNPMAIDGYRQGARFESTPAAADLALERAGLKQPKLIAGDKIVFTPKKGTETKGIIREEVTSTSGAKGWNVIKEDGSVVRLWERDGQFRVTEKAKELPHKEVKVKEVEKKPELSVEKEPEPPKEVTPKPTKAKEAAPPAKFAIKAAKLPKIKTVDDLIKAFRNEEIVSDTGRAYSDFGKAIEKDIKTWPEKIKSIKQTKDTITVTLEEGKQKFVVPEKRAVEGAEFLGYAKGKKGTGVKIGDAIRKKLKSLTKVDEQFAKNPTFTVRKKGEVLEANYTENGNKRSYKFFSENISPRIKEAFDEGMLKEGDKITLSEGYLENKSPAIYLVKKETSPKGITLYSGIDPTLFRNTMKSISAATSQIIENAKAKPEIRGGVKIAKNAMIEHDRNIRNAEFISKKLEKVVKDIVPKEDRQMLMVHAYEHKMKGKYWNALNEIEKGVVRWAAQEKAKLNKYIKDNDILEMMESKNINHIFHHWINPETGEPYTAVYGKFSKGLPQAKQRYIPTYEAGIKYGLKPATTNLGKLIGLEWEAATRANNARQLFKVLHGIKGDPEMSIVLRKGKKPQPIRMVERWDQLQKQGLTEDYIRYDSPFLDKAIVFKSADGTLVRMKGAVGIRKELYPFVKSYIESPNYGILAKLNFVSKSLKLGISMFHVISLGMQELANIRVPFVHIPKGLRLTKELGPAIQLLHQEGLELFKGYEDLGYRNQFFDGGSKLGRLGNTVTWPIAKMRDFIFNYVQPGMKTSFADMLFRKLLPEYLEKAGETIKAEEVMTRYEQGLPIPEAAKKCARDVVLKADGHFSGEHYKRSLLETNRFMVKLYFTPEARAKWQAALLSPTWQRKHLLVAKDIAKSFMPDSMIKKLGLAELGPIKSQYRRYALGGIMIIGAVDLWNQMSTLMMDGESKHIWENPKGKGFAVRAWWNEPDYQIITKTGERRIIRGGPAYIRPLKSLFEVAEWAHDPFKKISYKLSPVMTAIGGQLFENRGYEGIPDIPERTWDFITDVSTPIVIDQLIDVAKGKKPIEGAILPFFGMPTSKVKGTTKKSKLTLKKASNY